jgi:hypothetical protein
VDEEVRAVRIRGEDHRTITAVRPVVLPRVVLAALIAIVVSVAPLVPCARARTEREHSGEENHDSPM